MTTPTVSMVPPTLGMARMVQQGRWWCEACRVMWSGSWVVSTPDDWEPIHDCGAAMIRTGGDERADDY